MTGIPLFNYTIRICSIHCQRLRPWLQCVWITLFGLIGSSFFLCVCDKLTIISSISVQKVQCEWSELVESCQPYQVKLTTCQSLAWVRSECWVNSNKLCFLNSATAEAFMQLSHLHGAASTQLHLRTMISELGYSELMTIVIYSKLRATFDDHVMWTLLQLRIDWSELSCTEKECVNKKSELNCFYHDCGSACPTFDPGRLLNQFLFLGKKIFWHPPISLTLNNEGSVTFLFFIESPLSFDHVN